jgi:hypothetical protein
MKNILVADESLQRDSRSRHAGEGDERAAAQIDPALMLIFTMPVGAIIESSAAPMASQLHH